MLKNKYRSAVANGIFKTQVWMLLAFVMLLSNMLLSLKIFNINTAQETILVPTNLVTSHSFEGGMGDVEYIEELSNDFIQARMTYNPQVVATKFRSFAKHFHPSIYGEKKADLDAEATKIIRLQESGVFYSMGIHVKGKTAFIEGVFKSYLGKQEVINEIRYYEIEYKYSGNRFWIRDWRRVVPDATGKTYIPFYEDELALQAAAGE